MARMLERGLSQPIATLATIAVAFFSGLAIASPSAAQQAVVVTGGFTFFATEGSANTDLVATFVDPDASPQTGDTTPFAASIDWGDGGSSAGTLFFDSDLDQYGVTGNHTYADEGTFTITVTVSKTGAPDGSATSSAEVAEADDLSGTPVTFNTTVGTPISGALAHFSNTNTNNVASDFVSTVDWGDGSPVAAGAVSQPTPGSYDVSGTHTYAAPGLFSIAVTLAEDPPGTATATVQSSATVAALGSVAVPTLGGWGLGALVAGLAIAAVMLLRQR